MSFIKYTRVSYLVFLPSVFPPTSNLKNASLFVLLQGLSIACKVLVQLFGLLCRFPDGQPEVELSSFINGLAFFAAASPAMLLYSCTNIFHALPHPQHFSL